MRLPFPLRLQRRRGLLVLGTAAHHEEGDEAGDDDQADRGDQRYTSKA